MRHPFFIATAVSLVLLFAAATRAGEGLHFYNVQKLVVSGRVVAAASGEPLSGAQVTIDRGDAVERTTTGSDGEFTIEMTSTASLGDVSIVVSHVDSQEKYLETVFRDLYDGSLKVRVDSTCAVRGPHDLAAKLDCGSSCSVATRRGIASKVTNRCEPGLRGVEVAVGKNRLTLLAASPFALKISSGSLSVSDLRVQTLHLRLEAAMLPR